MTQANELQTATTKDRLYVAVIEGMYRNRNNFIFRDGDDEDLVAFVHLRISFNELDADGNIDYDNDINNFIHVAFDRRGQIWVSVANNFMASNDSWVHLGNRYYAFGDLIEPLALNQLLEKRDTMYGFYPWKTVSDVKLRQVKTPMPQNREERHELLDFS